MRGPLPVAEALAWARVSASRKTQPAAGGNGRPGKATAARPGTARSGAAAKATKTAKATRTAKAVKTAKAVRSGPASGATRRPRTATPRTGRPPVRARTSTVVVGMVPPLARVAGGLGLAGALVRLVVPAFALAEAGGRQWAAGANLADWAVLLPLTVGAAAAGLLCLLGRLPRLGLAALMAIGTVQGGVLLHALYLHDGSQRSTVDLPVGSATSLHYQPRAGLTLLIVAAALLVAAAVAAVAGWPQTIMEDDGSLDPRRPRLAAYGLIVGVFAVLALGMAPYASVPPGNAPSSLPERAGLDLFAGLVTVLGVAVWAVLAAALRPRLAAVGVYLGLVAVLATEWLSTALLVARSPALRSTTGGSGTVVVILVVGELAFAAWRLPFRPITPAGDDEDDDDSVGQGG